MRQIGRYRLDRVMGSGAFATVWKGYDPQLETAVAIKVLADNWSMNADVRERFLTEARLLRRIESRRVVRVHDVGALGGDIGVDGDVGMDDGHGRGVHADRPYFVMDYIDGGTVAEQVGRLAPAEAVRLASEAAEAVQVLHEAGVVHRDIKPSNLLIDTSVSPSRVVVADLGSAKMLADATGITVTTGTPAYMAPEQAGRDGGFDGRADVYALAVVSYELLAGHCPFGHLSAGDLMFRTADVRPQSLVETIHVPAQVDQVLASGLDPDPERRPPNAHAFGQALLAAAAPPTADEHRRPRADDWPLGAVIGLAVVLFVAAALVSWLIV